MRKIQRAPVEVFNIAFLDIISCAFGAVVMLVLLAKNGTEDTERGPSNVSVLIDQVLQAQVDVETLKGALSDKLQELKAAQRKTASVTEQKDNLDSSIPRAQQTTPTLALANKDDTLVPWQRSQMLAEAMPNAELSVMEYGGHASSITNTIAFNELLR